MNKRDFYNKTVSFVKSNISEIEKANREIENYTRRWDSGDHRPEVSEKIHELKAKISDIKAEAKTAYVKMCDDYKKELIEADSLRGDQLTDDANLLNFGLLGKRDLESMLKRNEGNRTMLQLICRYAKKNDINLGVSYVGNDDIIASLQSFPYTVETVLKWADRPSVYEQLMGEGSDLDVWSQN